MRNRYDKILRNDLSIAQTVSKNSDSFDTPLGQLSLNVVVPTLILYVKWILTESKRKNIKRLYFFARDGYLMYHTALILCSKLKFDIECSYFYCSRYSLRMASYRFFDDSAYDKLFIHSYKLSAYNMLKRAGFSDNERFEVYKEIDFPLTDEQKIMTKTKFNDFCSKVKESKAFIKILKEKSDIAYENTLLYIKQESIPDYDKIGIVDLGWTGSLQRTLKRILDSADIKTHLCGFYLGMLETPPKLENSEYNTWLFNENDVLVKSWFAYNLMECIFTAPHGMTMGYTDDQGIIMPIFSEEKNAANYIEVIKEISEKFAADCDLKYCKKHKKLALRLLKQLMFNPSEQEVNLFRDLCFCDDVGEQYQSNIVQITDKRKFKNQFLFHKIINRKEIDNLYWYCGSLKISNVSFKKLYKYVFLLTNVLVISLKKLIQHKK